MQRIILLGVLFVGVTLAAVAVPPEVDAIQTAIEAENYAETTGIVTAQYQQSHGKGPATEVIEFEYEVDGRTYDGDNHLTQFDDDAALIHRLTDYRGDREVLTVYYDPKHPRTVLIHKDVGLAVPVAIICVAGLCLYIPVAGLIDERRKRKKEAERQRGRGRAV